MPIPGWKSLLIFTVIVVVQAHVLFISPVQADFMDGLAAYDGGDYATARIEWLALAERGDPVSQTALAGLYASGMGVGQNFVVAARWFRRAAEQGHMIAQLNLGDFYARGLGVASDLTVAWVWLSLAARQGNDWAARRRDDVALRMTKTARCEAGRRLVDWRPSLR